MVNTHSDSYSGRIVHTASPTHDTLSVDMSEVNFDCKHSINLMLMPDFGFISLQQTDEHVVYHTKYDPWFGHDSLQICHDR
jgi:hypothetical protein